MFENLRNSLRQLKDHDSGVEFSPKNLMSAYEAVRSRYDEGQLSTGVSLKEIVKKIEESVINGTLEVVDVLEKKEQKFIPYIAYSNKPPFITKDRFLKFCVSQINNTNKSSVLSGWLHNYLMNKNIDSSNNGYIGELIKSRIKTYSGKSRRIKHWQKNAKFIINEEEKVAKNLLNYSLSFNQYFEKHRLSTELNESDFTDNVVKCMIDCCRERNLRHLSQVVEELKYTSKDGRKYYRDKKVVRYAASKLLEQAGFNCDEKTKEQLKKPFLKILKDPRIKTNPNWGGVKPSSIGVMKQWLSARDIEFFFEIVSKTEEKYSLDTHWEYRKAFWMAYLPYIEDTWVAMGNTARDFAKYMINDSDISYSDFGRLRGAESIQSVFFLRIKGYDIVEYSHKGASRIWEINDSPLKFRKKSVHVNNFRRDAPDHIEKFSHYNSERYRWQSTLSIWLKRKMSIEPTQSYRIY